MSQGEVCPVRFLGGKDLKVPRVARSGLISFEDCLSTYALVCMRRQRDVNRFPGEMGQGDGALMYGLRLEHGREEQTRWMNRTTEGREIARWAIPFRYPEPA